MERYRAENNSRVPGRSRSPHRMERTDGRVDGHADSNRERPRKDARQERLVKDANKAKNEVVIATVVENEPNSKYAIHLLKYIQTRMVEKQNQQFRFPFIHEVSNYDKVMKIGQGTFGEVFKARCKKTQRFVALKKILMDNEKEGFPITAIREVKMLHRLRNDYITELIEICNTKCAMTQDKSTFYLVFTFCDYDLAGLLSSPKVKLGLEDIKCMVKHLLTGLFMIHKVNILHRDMKTANILVTPEGVLRLADFGLSRCMIKSGKPVNYTNRVVTLWYRPPELLLGSRRYGPAIDLWGAGCIMAELWTRTPILQGGTEQQQLELIQNMCGGVNKTVWPGVELLPYFNKLTLNPDKPRILHNKMSPIIKDPKALNLLDQLLTLDPSKRVDANKALEDDFFFEDPMPRDNIKHVLFDLPKNIFEFTAGRGAHANRQPRNNQARIADVVPNQPMNGGDRRRPYLKNPADNQLQDIIY